MLELELNMTANEALADLRQRGLVVRSERELARRAGSHHWHLGFPGRAGTIELSEWKCRVWVKVHPRRDGGWATACARAQLGGQAHGLGGRLVLAFPVLESWPSSGEHDRFALGVRRRDFLGIRVMNDVGGNH